MKCLLAPLAPVIMLVGLSACDEGRITETATPVEPVTASERLTIEQKVQKNIFNAHCVQCHGGSATAGAGLYLTEGHETMANRKSAIEEGEILLVPGNHESSLLYKAVASDISVTRDWQFHHNSVLNESEKYLMATWIDLQ